MRKSYSLHGLFLALQCRAKDVSCSWTSKTGVHSNDTWILRGAMETSMCCE